MAMESELMTKQPLDDGLSESNGRHVKFHQKRATVTLDRLKAEELVEVLTQVADHAYDTNDVFIQITNQKRHNTFSVNIQTSYLPYVDERDDKIHPF